MGSEEQTHTRRYPRRTLIGIASVAVLTLTIAGTACGSRQPNADNQAQSAQSPAQSSSDQAPTQESGASTATPTPTEATPTAPACEDGSPTPIGTCLYPASVQWLPDLLPDPREVDRTDPEAVARAYVITRNVWDASRDKSNAYAYIRASVYEVPELASSHTKTPDLQHGQGEFLPLLANRAHTTVTITGSNNHGQQPNTDPTRWYGNVYYERNYSDNSLEPVKKREVVFLRLQDDGTWAVTDSGPY
ncbi:hypothetical protein O3654_08120 [Pauljensenia sp. 20925_1_91]